MNSTEQLQDISDSHPTGGREVVKRKTGGVVTLEFEHFVLSFGGGKI